MLNEINHVLKNPNDIPDVPHAVKEYLQVRYNFTYLDATNHMTLMRNAGCSEAHMLGFIEGLTYASKVLDEIELIKEANRDEED